MVPSQHDASAVEFSGDRGYCIIAPQTRKTQNGGAEDNIMKRGFRWFLFLIAFFDFFVVLSGRANVWTVGVFFAAGCSWYFLERRKMRELDAPSLRERMAGRVEGSKR